MRNAHTAELEASRGVAHRAMRIAHRALPKQPIDLRARAASVERAECALLRDLRRRGEEGGVGETGERTADADAADTEGGGGVTRMRIQPGA